MVTDDVEESPTSISSPTHSLRLTGSKILTAAASPIHELKAMAVVWVARWPGVPVRV